MPSGGVFLNYLLSSETAARRMGRVDFGGVRKWVCLEDAPAAMVGNRVFVHLGFSLQAIGDCRALRSASKRLMIDSG